VRFAVSNIAWGPREDPSALTYLRERGVEGVEIAPTRLWPDWEGAGARAAGAYRRVLEDAGLTCPALQAVLFGQPELLLFGTAGQRRRLEDHLRRVAEIAAALGAMAVVFGSPANRLRDGLSSQEAFASATTVLRRVGEVYDQQGVKLVIEANPPEYGCDFVTHLPEARALVEAVDSVGVALHADSGAMLLNGEDPATLRRYAPELAYFHASEPFLRPLTAESGHGVLGRALSAGGYDGWCSVEMRRPGSGLKHIESATRVAFECYGRAIQ
jgi:D-psicose/D-tagatose/L-ribulose 3-epimerase